MFYAKKIKTNMKLACRHATCLKRDSNTGVLCGTSETFTNSDGCFLKHVTCYYIIKSYVGYKRHPFILIAFIANPLIRRDAQG